MRMPIICCWFSFKLTSVRDSRFRLSRQLAKASIWVYMRCLVMCTCKVWGLRIGLQFLKHFGVCALESLKRTVMYSSWSYVIEVEDTALAGSEGSTVDAALGFTCN